MMSGRILVVGSLNMDLVVHAPRHPHGGETLLGSGFATYPGGKGANQAVAVARLGGLSKVMVVGCATCVAECAAGGEREVETLAPLLALALKEKGNAQLARQCFVEAVFVDPDSASPAWAEIDLPAGTPGADPLRSRLSARPR